MIVCDTNIWYDLGTGKIPTKEVEGLELACTHLTLNELTSSLNLVRNSKAVKNAIRAIRAHAKQMHFANPFEFSISKLKSDHRANDNNGIFMCKKAQVLLYVDIKIPADKVSYVEELLHNSVNDYKEFIQELNKYSMEIKKIIKEQNLKKRRRAQDDTLKIQTFLIEILNEYYKTNYHRNELIISQSAESWKNFELYIHAMSDFFKNIDVSPDQKVHSNDYGDMFNMLYVGENDLYWTSEKKWNKIIKENPVIHKYLYNHRSI